MLKYTISAGFALGFVTLAASANAQTALGTLSNCDPITGLTPTGEVCVALSPTDPTDINNPTAAIGARQYDRLDTSELAQTYDCEQIAPQQGVIPVDAALLLENCGPPLADAKLKNPEPFFGTVNAPAPVVATTPIAPAPIVATTPIAPAPVLYTAPIAPAPVLATAPIIAPAAPIVQVAAPVVPAAVTTVTAPVAAVSSVGLGNAGLIFAGVSAAALLGIIAIAASDDDDDDNSTNSTR